jgi:hypothetical protein
MIADFPATAYEMKTIGKPDAGNLHVRFDEGEQAKACSLLYCLRSAGYPALRRQ